MRGVEVSLACHLLPSYLVVDQPLPPADLPIISSKKLDGREGLWQQADQLTQHIYFAFKWCDQL